MVDQLNGFASEVTRVAREVGTEGKLGGQAQVPGVAGTWKDLTDNVNFMASNLTGQVRNIADVTTAVARGDLSRKITVDVRGEILELKNTINTMVDQLNAFASEVSRVAREVGTEGKLGGQAEVEGVAGTWKDLTDNVNSMASNLTSQVRNIAEVTIAVANGDLSKKITVDVRGEILELKETINTMVDQLRSFAAEVTRVAREVGTDGKLGGQAAGARRGRHLEGPHRQRQLDGLQPHRPGPQHRRRGHRHRQAATSRRKITVDVKGEILQLKETINTMVEQLSAFASEVTRVAREVGTEGKLGGQAQVPGVAGTWKDLTDNVNSMASNLTGQVRNIAEVTIAVANGDLSKKITVDVRGEILQLKETINTMVEQLRSFASEVTRVAREVGTEGRLGVQAVVPGVAGTWKDLTDSVNTMGSNLTAQVRNIAEVTTAVARGDLSAQDHRRREGRNPRAQEHHQHDGRSAQRLRLRSDARGARGRHRRQARRPGPGLRRGRHLEGPDRQRQLHGLQPHRPGARHREGRDRRRRRQPAPEADRAGQGRGRRAGRDDQQHDRHAGDLRRAGDQRGPRGRRRRPAGRPGQRARRRRHVERPHRQRQPAGRQPHHAGARHRRGGHRRDQGRPDALDPGRRRGEVAELKDNINTMIANLRETTERNKEQDWLKTNIARFTGMLQGQRDLVTVGQMLLADLVPLVQAQQGAIYQMAVGDDEQPELRLLAGYAQRPGQPEPHPARRRAGRPVRRREAAHPAHRRAAGLHPHQLQPRRGPALEHRRAAGAVRRPDQGGHRAGLAPALHLRRTSPSSSSSPRASAWCSTRSRRRCAPRACSSSRSS